MAASATDLRRGVQNLVALLSQYAFAIFCPCRCSCLRFFLSTGFLSPIYRQAWAAPLQSFVEVLVGDSMNWSEIRAPSSRAVSSVTGRRRKADCLWSAQGDTAALDLLFFENSISTKGQIQHTAEDNVKLVCGCLCVWMQASG